MGHNSGRLFTAGHLAVSYPYVFEMTADLRPERFLESPLPPAGFGLPADALVIASRLAAAWEFASRTIWCSDGWKPGVALPKMPLPADTFGKIRTGPVPKGASESVAATAATMAFPKRNSFTWQI